MDRWKRRRSTKTNQSINPASCGHNSQHPKDKSVTKAATYEGSLKIVSVDQSVDPRSDHPVVWCSSPFFAHVSSRRAALMMLERKKKNNNGPATVARSGRFSFEARESFLIYCVHFSDILNKMAEHVKYSGRCHHLWNGSDITTITFWYKLMILLTK